LKPGRNEIVIQNLASVDVPLVAAEARIEFRPRASALPKKAGPPVGPLPEYAPRKAVETAFTAAETAGGGIDLTVNGETFHVASRFSTPAPGWVVGPNDYFDFKRTVEKTPEVVIVRDTFTNRTQDPLPLMHRHEADPGQRLDKLWLTGLEQPDKAGSLNQPANPTVYVGLGASGFGLIPLDDVFRIHAQASAESGHIALADEQLVLKPGGAYTAEWAIIPTDAPDYWAFLNAARRLMNANFRIDGGFAFLRNGPMTDAWTDQQVNDFLGFKDPLYVCASIDYPRYNGQYTHGTVFQRVDHASYRNSFARWRGLQPDRKYLVYFHCFIDVAEDGPRLFADAIHVDSNGKHADYGDPVSKLYVPLATNAFGPAVAKNVDIILDEIGADGVYWDEHEYSRCLYHYAEPWDGFSGDIDPVTMKVARLKSSTTLLTESWRLDLARRILGRGALVGNGPPLTRAVAALHFPCFVETGSISNCTQAHLYSPLALGDHLTERSEVDAYGTMLAALDFGCVYHWYNDVSVVPAHPHLTSYMFPITPVELHEGFIIGKERIVTNRSGLYGWGDMSEHEVHVFDDTGREATGYATPEVVKENARFTELRIGQGWSAAIVRH
jgi:hypothetical protein